MEKIDLVYILGKGSRWSDNELRYSLRSAEAYFPHRNVFIIGEKPDWLTGIIHIKAKDSDTNKLLNARSKYIIAALDSRISENFVLMNDDFFFQDEIKEIPYYSRGLVSEMIKKHPTKGGYYYQALKDTNYIIKKMGIPKPKDFEIHAPIIFNKSELLSVIKMVGNNKAYLLRTCYSNFINAKAKKVIDFKTNNAGEFAYQLKRKGAFISINDALVLLPEFRNWIERKYPKASKYEIDKGTGTKTMPGRSAEVMRYYATRIFTYNRKTFNKGDMIDPETMLELKANNKMKDCWKLA